MDNQPNNNQEQEVDLVPVFVWISNGFKNLFNAIGGFFKGLGHFLILFLIFIKNNIILLGILFVLGAGLGNYLSRQSKNIFTAQMRIQPNFGSAAQLISNLEYYNSLADQEDSVALAKEIGITPSEAAKLKSFEIEPDFNDTELLKEYDELARAADTMALDNFTFEGFKESKRDMDYEFYKVLISGSSRFSLNKTAPLAIQVKDNSVIKGLRLSTGETVNFNIKNLEYQLANIDSLIGAYQIAIKSSNTESTASTNVYMGNEKNANTFNDLYYQRTSILERLKEERIEKYTIDNTINISSFYVKRGTIENEHLTLKVAFIFLGLGLLTALLPIIIRYLNQYQKKNIK
ncbi:hypothetical protein [Nonlabens sp. Asnod3-A02]|uniref:hypothetical protein n=1 Tax=Nonlabens sp. Asnod3-A02 TaxID=3160579 RepID=UPI0038684E30